MRLLKGSWRSSGCDGGLARRVDVTVEPGEDRFVEQFAGVLGGGVQIAWPVEQVECGGEDRASGFEGVVRFVGVAG